MRGHRLTLTVAVMFSGLIIIFALVALLNGKVLVAISCFILLVILMYLGGRWSAPFYLEGTVLKILKENGGKMPYSQMDQYFQRSCPKNKAMAEDALKDVVASLVKKKVIAVEGEIVSLL